MLNKMLVTLSTISLVMISVAIAGFSIGNNVFISFAQDDLEGAIGTVIPNETYYGGQTITNITDNSSNTTSEVNATSASDSQFTAESIYNTNSLIADNDVTEVVVMIPDDKMIQKQFLPGKLTIAPETTVIWINGQNNPNGITLYNSEGKELLTNSTIPFANATSYEFNKKGVYSFTSTTDPSVNGTVTVVSPQSLMDITETNATTHTVGLFVAPTSEKEYWNYHLNTIGFNIKSIYDYPLATATTSSEIDEEEEGTGTLYLYTQKLSKFSSVVDRVSKKLHSAGVQIAKLP